MKTMPADVTAGLSLKFFILITVFFLHVKAEEKKMGMAPDAVDDNFSQCRDKMLKAVTEPNGLLQKERKANKTFDEMWKKHSGECKKNIAGGTSHHLDALQLYGTSEPKFRSTFNKLVYSAGSNSSTYREKFPFKSLHFLLTDSIRLLNPNKSCKNVFYSTQNTYTADVGTEVRFGKFIAAEISLSSAAEKVEVDGGTMFNITSCSVVNVEENLCKSEELQCLISPSEFFTVQNVKDVKTDDGSYKMITLTHSRLFSHQDCLYFHRSDLDPQVSPAGSSPPVLRCWMLVAVMAYVLAGLLL